MIRFLKILFFIGFATAIEKNNNLLYQVCTELNFLPMPQSIQCDITNQQKQQIKDPCSILYILKSQTIQTSTDHIEQLIQDQQYKTFKCHFTHFEIYSENLQTNDHEVVVEIQLMDSILKSPFTQKQQSYSLRITQGHANLQARHYAGFVRGLQTFLQSITCNKKKTDCFMIGLPIKIEDQPLFELRGLMVDSSRHFIPINILEQTIDAMMYNKLNVLHWHIVDDDSFPLELQSHPELAQYGSFSIYERYTTDEVRKFVRYAMIRGVRVIPQIDTPGHTASWSRAPQNSAIACKFPNKYKGSLDVTLHKTYTVVKEVFKQIFQLFPDPYVHLGGDSTILICMNNKTEFNQKQNITEKDTETHYRRKQRKMLKQLDSTKKFIYWLTQDSVSVDPDDTVHWYGKGKLVPPVSNKIILTNARSQFNLDMGAGGILGQSYYSYATWYDMHRLNIGQEIKGFDSSYNVAGVIVSLRSEISNQYTHHAKIWIRSSSIAQRLWTSQQHKSKPDFLKRLASHEKLMNRRGIPTSPATCQQCQIHPQFC